MSADYARDLEVSLAFHAGRDARNDNVPMSENPHQVGSVLYIQWSNGWHEADMALRKRA